MPGNVYIIDNGAYTLKVGFANSTPEVAPNCVTKAKSEKQRPFVSDQLQECRELSGLFYMLPFQKGYLYNLDLQKQIWDYVFEKESCKVDLSEVPVIFTEPCFDFPSIRETIAEVLFKEYECESLLTVNASELSAYHYFIENSGPKNCLIVDSGYSFTHVVPYINGAKYKEGILRIDVGGKLLTNHLKDIISYRQLNVMEETYVINQVKEDICYVTDDLFRDMNIARKRDSSNTIARSYVLPDYTNVRRGYVLNPGEKTPEDCQILKLANERFTIPEILFSPSNVGIYQMGIPEAVVHSVSHLCPLDAQSELFNNIVLTGGNALFPGFKERIYKDIRALTPDKFSVHVYLPENPVTYAWEGGALVSQDPDFYSYVVTKEEYKIEGFYSCYEKFDV